MKFKNLTIYFFIAHVFIFGCENKPDTPEEVIEQYSALMRQGECQKAMEFCDDEGKMTIQAAIDAGCQPYESIIDSIICETVDTIAKCTCYETSFDTSWPIKYKLAFRDGEWKILGLPKDSIDW